MLVGEHDERVADLDLGVADPASGRGDAKLLGGSKRLLVELDGLRRVVGDQVGRRRVVAIGNRLGFGHYEVLLPSTIRRDASWRHAALLWPPSRDVQPRSRARLGDARRSG